MICKRNDADHGSEPEFTRRVFLGGTSLCCLASCRAVQGVGLLGGELWPHPVSDASSGNFWPEDVWPAGRNFGQLSSVQQDAVIKIMNGQIKKPGTTSAS